MKLHIPVLLRKALLACFAVGSLYSGGTTAAADLTLGSEDTLSINYAESDSIPDLESGTLQLNGDTLLLLAECGEGDGKIYTLLTGVSSLLDKDGNAITLDSSNNAASLYFDTSQPGTGFWADATLLLNANGTLQLVRHNAPVMDAVTITSRRTNGASYRYYKGVSFENITFSSSDAYAYAYGGAIYGSTITLSDNGSVTFSGNTASSSGTSSEAYGGAIYGDYYSTIELSGNGSVEFSGNTASSSSYAYGGAIYGHSGSTITLNGNGSVTFSGNRASSSGGAISGSTITLSWNGSVTFSGNTASASSSYARGGAIYGYSGSTITLSGNGSVTFSGNTASSSAYSSEAYGGAIYGHSGSTITLSDNGSVTFSGNTASSSDDWAYGGAIYGRSSSTIELSDNGSVMFSGNTASSSGTSSEAYGGAIYGDNYSTITLNDNGSVEFSGNTAFSSGIYSSESYGGAIYGGEDSTITLSGNESVTFSENTAESSYSSYGGAIYGRSNSTITLSNNGSVTFSGNTARYGGAIYGGTITLSGNESVEFSGNGASYYGGAISGSTITLSGNESVEFSGNGASYYGGAIYGRSNSTITLSDNGSVTFSGNTAYYSAYSSEAYGGAIYGGSDSTITLSDNGSVTFSGNTVSSYSSYACGGAIYTYGKLSIRNNDMVEFYQNAEVVKGSYRLRSIYANGGGGCVISLSSAAGKSITFRDSIYITSGSTFKLNEDYTYLDEEGVSVTVKQQGDIIFTGATTEDDLKDAKGGVAGTETEILNSRTSEINSAATLYGGTLQVHDKAVLKLNGGLTVAEGSRAAVQVRAAELDLGGKALNMVGGSSLELTDGAKLTNTSLTIETDATLTVRGVTSTVKAETRVAALTMSKSMVEGVVSVRSANTGSVCVLDGDLTLESGSRICFDGAYLELTGDLVFDVESGAEKIALEISPGLMMDDAGPLALFSVGGTVTFSMDGQPAVPDGDQVYTIKATDYFIGSMLSESTTLVYDAVNNVMYLEGVANVPEPATTMLGLVGMVALTFRRRRK